jgi:transposase
MERIYPRCAGIDVHKDSLAVCARIDGRESIESFGTTSREILRLGDRLAALGVTVVAMESTGVYWKPLWNLLEDRFALMLVNARHVKNVPGRKTDVKDSQWLAALLEHGLLRPSFVPPLPQRELRDLTRQRTQLLGDRARVVNRIQKVLETANLKIASLITDLAGASGRRVLHAIVEGKLTPPQMAELVDTRMAHKKPLLAEALVGKVSGHHRFMLRQLLEQLDHLDRQIDHFDLRIAEVMSPLEREAVERLDAIPGFDVRTGQNVIAEIGCDMSRFPDAAHLASWAGLCPGNHESAGKRKGGKTRKANRWLKSALTQSAWGASRTRRSYFAAQHRRLTARRGKKRASIAVAHSLLVVSYHLLREPRRVYTDLGAGHFDRRQADPDAQARRMIRRLEAMGYKVDLQPAAA